MVYWTLTVLFLMQESLLFTLCRECSLSFYGFDYRGKKSTTRSGRTCQVWTSQSPHPHGFTKGYMFADGSVAQAGNFCRNPNRREGGPWCFTMHKRIIWEYCDIPRCSRFPECRLTEGGSEYRGNIAVTNKGRPCASWDNMPQYRLMTVPSHEENYCRNHDGKDGPWCHIKGHYNEVWDYCDVPFCKPPMHCIPNTASYTSFVGTLSVTENGRMCQRWSSKAPHKHHFTDEHFLDGSANAAKNYCRSPDGDEEGAWCYTTDPEVRWEYCDVPRCEKDCKISKAGREYSGNRNTTLNGYECQRWDSQQPHPHNMTSSDRFPDVNATLAENYCRNPDGGLGGPWCFTTNETVKWDFCDIPECPHDTDAYPRTPRARHVLHIGIDGLHPECVKNATFGAKNIMTKLVEKGTYTFTRARTVLNTKSGPGWSTILCGQGVETSGVTTNEWKPMWQGSKEGISPANGVQWPFPCVFEALKSQDASIRTAFYYDWDFLRHFANSGVPGSVDNDQQCRPGMGLYAICDASLTTKASAYIREVVHTAERTYTFVYLGNVDVMGHSFSWCSSMYAMAVTYADMQVGMLLNAVDDAGSDNFLVMLSTDHGGSGKGHGEQADSDIRVPMFIRGPGIEPNKEFPYTVQTRDMVPTAADFLGLRQNPWWTGRPLKEAYQTKTRPRSNVRK